MFHTFLVLSENATRVSFTVSVRNTTIAQVRENVSYPMKRSVWLAMILSVCVVIVQMVIACRSPYAKNAPTAVNYALNMVVINAHMDLLILIFIVRYHATTLFRIVICANPHRNANFAIQVII